MQDWTSEPGRRGPGDNGGTWIAFLAATFLVVGMVGLFGTYAAPLTYQREIRVDSVLNMLAAVPPAQREGLREALGDSADAVLKGAGPIEPRIAAERIALRARFEREAEATGERIRLIIVVVTLTGAVFGAVLMRLQRRG